MKIKSWVLGLIVLVFIFGGIGASAALGYWQTESTKTPATYQSGEFAGEYNPADIRGSYSFGEISQLFDVPLADLRTAFALESVSALSDFQCKELETYYPGLSSGVEIGTDSVRVFVALYKGLPYTLSGGTYLLEPAVAILKTKAKLTAEQTAFLDTHSVKLNDSAPISTAPTATETASGEQHAVAGTVTGKTTFQELLDWGVPSAEIEAVIGEKLPSAGLSLRDYAAQKGLEFTVLKTALQARVDAVK